MLQRAESVFSNIALLAGPVFLCVALVTLLTLWLMRRLGTTLGESVPLLLIAFGVLGGISGVIAGASEEAIVGALVTGILGVVSVLLSYIITRDIDQTIRSAVPPLIIALLVNALVGIAVGQNWRRKWDTYRIELTDYRQDYDNIWIPVSRQIKLELLKKCIAESTSFADARANCTYRKMEEPGPPAIIKVPEKGATANK